MVVDGSDVADATPSSPPEANYLADVDRSSAEGYLLSICRGFGDPSELTSYWKAARSKLADAGGGGGGGGGQLGNSSFNVVEHDNEPVKGVSLVRFPTIDAAIQGHSATEQARSEFAGIRQLTVAVQAGWLAPTARMPHTKANVGGARLSPESEREPSS